MTSPCAALDRIGPTRRPSGRASGFQRWRDLSFVHYTYDPALVRALVPANLELDLWEERAWVGLVPFTMHDVRPSWLPFGFNFPETNLRTYVHHRGVPGVFFFSLDASSRLAVQAARRMWSLPHFHADMQLEREGTTLRYRSARRDAAATSGNFEIEYGDETPRQAEPDTLDFFLLERYWLYSWHRGRVRSGQVHHTPYRAQPAQLRRGDPRLLMAASLPAPPEPPAAVHYSAGVDVEVFGPFDLAD